MLLLGLEVLRLVVDDVALGIIVVSEEELEVLFNFGVLEQLDSPDVMSVRHVLVDLPSRVLGV